MNNYEKWYGKALGKEELLAAIKNAKWPYCPYPDFTLAEELRTEGLVLRMSEVPGFRPYMNEEYCYVSNDERGQRLARGET